MFAVFAESINPDAPLEGLVVGEQPRPEAPEGWTAVQVKAASINHHDIWSLKGVGLPEERLPMTLGCDAAGIDEDGNEVVVHAVIGDPDWTGDETLDPKRSILSERYPGTFAETIVVPKKNVLPKPASLTMSEAACLPTAWLTAYKMLFSQSRLRPGNSVLIQGASGSVATAAIALARAAGMRVFVTSRDETKRQRAMELGAHEALPTGSRLPHRVDAVIETVGEATWGHSLRALRPGGTLVVSGATSGEAPSAELNRVFFLQLRVQGSTMGTRDEFASLLEFMDVAEIKPVIDRELPMAQAADGLQAVIDGEVFGKVVLTL